MYTSLFISTLLFFYSFIDTFDIKSIDNIDSFLPEWVTNEFIIYSILILNMILLLRLYYSPWKNFDRWLSSWIVLYGIVSIAYSFGHITNGFLNGFQLMYITLMPAFLSYILRFIYTAWLDFRYGVGWILSNPIISSKFKKRLVMIKIISQIIKIYLSYLIFIFITSQGILYLFSIEESSYVFLWMIAITLLYTLFTIIKGRINFSKKSLRRAKKDWVLHMSQELDSWKDYSVNDLSPEAKRIMDEEMKKIIPNFKNILRAFIMNREHFEVNAQKKDISKLKQKFDYYNNDVFDLNGIPLIEKITYYSRKWDLDSLKEILNANPSVDLDTLSESWYNALIFSVADNQIDITNYLLGKWVNTDIKNITHWATALHFASKYWYIHMVELLIKFKADLNITDDYGKTPLISSIESKNYDIAELLLSNWANIKVKDWEWLQAIDYAKKYKQGNLVQMLK